jgi:large subunit ribosomal protein L22
MTGPKRNEGATKPNQRTGTRCVVRYVRSTPSKARQVLDLIRGLDVRRADQVLQFTDRDVARTVRKALASAVANAVHNEEQDADELKVVACFADEGPTLRRFRPRARGRATRIRKRTCHITVIVGRMSDRELAVLQAKEGAGHGRGRGASPATAARRARVERSRQQRAAAKAAEAGVTEETVEEDVEETPADEAPESEEVVVDEVTLDEDTAADEVADSDEVEAGAEAAESEDDEEKR